MRPTPGPSPCPPDRSWLPDTFSRAQLAGKGPRCSSPVADSTRTQERLSGPLHSTDMYPKATSMYRKPPPFKHSATRSLSRPRLRPSPAPAPSPPLPRLRPIHYVLWRTRKLRISSIKFRVFPPASLASCRRAPPFVPHACAFHSLQASPASPRPSRKYQPGL